MHFKKKLKGLISLSLIVQNFIFCQEKIENTFRFPLDIKMSVGGNYGELRPNHFHAGLDLSTDRIQHLPIYAIENGYVSRIKVSTYGYGKVVYVTHPGGFVSVYAHQHHFANKINDYVYAEQKKLESFEVEIFPKPDELPVMKSEVIGFTGNTGRSSGPHLHFEIRDEKTETPLNPLLFYQHEDNSAPYVTKMAVYNVYEKGKPELTTSYQINKKNFPGGVWNGEKIILPKSAGLGFTCFDHGINNKGSNQVYGIQLKIDGEIIYEHKMNTIGFEETRCVNWIQENDSKYKHEKIQKCFVNGNNDLKIYKSLKNNGILNLNTLKPAPTHIAEALFYDINGNKTALTFEFELSSNGIDPKDSDFRLLFNHPNKIEIENSIFEFPAKTLFCDSKKSVELFKRNTGNFFSDIYAVLENGTLLMKKYRMKIKLNKKIDQEKQKKICAVEVDQSLKYRGYIGGEYQDGYLIAETYDCGFITVGMDDKPPVITPVSKKRGTVISFKVKDGMSGIGKFSMEINGKWVLAEYEHKEDLIFCSIPDNLPSGPIEVKLIVCDKKDNESNVCLKLN